MKTMTCKDMGGMCDHPMTAATPEEMIDIGMEHLKVAHPEMIESINSMSKDDPMMVAWYKSFQDKWEATPENA